MEAVVLSLCYLDRYLSEHRSPFDPGSEGTTSATVQMASSFTVPRTFNQGLHLALKVSVSFTSEELIDFFEGAHLGAGHNGYSFIGMASFESVY